MKKYVFIGIVIGVLVAFVGMHVPSRPVEAQLPFWNVFSTTATSGAVTLTATSQRILATSTERRWVVLQPGPSCAQGAYLSLNNDAAATSLTSVFLSASSTFTIDTSNLYTGSVTGISQQGNCTLLVTGKQ